MTVMWVRGGADGPDVGVHEVSAAIWSGRAFISGATVGRGDREGHEEQAEMDTGGSAVSGSEGSDSGGPRPGDLGAGAVEPAAAGERRRTRGFSDPDAVGDACGELDADDLQVRTGVKWVAKRDIGRRGCGEGSRGAKQHFWGGGLRQTEALGSGGDGRRSGGTRRRWERRERGSVSWKGG